MAYTKTVWKNEPDTSTPISAESLNNIENGIYNNDIAITNLTPVILYNNDSGNQGTVTLSDNADNYKFLDIIIWDFYISRVYNRGNRPVGLMKIGGYGGDLVETFSESIAINANIITRNGCTHATFRYGQDINFQYNENIPIRSVIGYKD